MFEYNLTSEMEFEQIRASNEQLSKENEELKQNLETLLDYNNKLLAVIEEINNNEAANSRPDDGYREYQNQLVELRDKVKYYEETNQQLVDELQRVRQQAPRASNKGGDAQVTRIVQDAVRNSESVQRKFEERLLRITNEVEEIKQATKAFKEDMLATFDDKQNKIEQVFDHFEKKDEIVQLMAQKVSILQEYSMNKKDRNERAAQTDQVTKGRNSIQNKGGDDGIRLQQKNRIIKIYEDLVSKLRKKVTEKTF